MASPRRPSNDSVLSYPRSRGSTISESPVVRSRTWSEDITRAWNEGALAKEDTMEERVKKYLLYFDLKAEQLHSIRDKFLHEMAVGLDLHRSDSKAAWDPVRCSLKMTDTCVDVIPNGTEKGTACALDFGGPDAALVRAVSVTLEGKGSISLSEVSASLREGPSEYPKGLLDKQATATQLFDTLANLVKKLKDEKMASSPGSPIPVGFTVCFPVEQKAVDRANLIHWVKGYETGRRTKDQVEGMDVVRLLDCAFWRQKVTAETKAVLNDTTGALLTCAYERPRHLPTCTVGFILGSGVNGCYVQPDIRSYNYKGTVINCELGNFDKGLPLNDVDLEVDFADESTKGVQLFEKMVAANYLGELCRRLVVKVWQKAAPPLSWVRHSMPWVACASVVSDDTAELTLTKDVVEGLWEWTGTTTEQRKTIQKLFGVVFNRSAALAAVAIVALASRTGRLQPAMGGLTCGIGGPMYSDCPLYAEKLRSYLKVVIEPEMAQLIHLHVVQDASAKGAGILATLLELQK